MDQAYFSETLNESQLALADMVSWGLIIELLESNCAPSAEYNYDSLQKMIAIAEAQLVEAASRKDAADAKLNHTEMVRPVQSAKGVEYRQQAVYEEVISEEAEELDQEALERWAKKNEEMEHEWKERLAKRDAAESQFERINTTTAELLKCAPERFINKLNETVQATWDEIKPIGVTGKQKGFPLPLPVFFINKGRLFLSVETWKKPIRLSNPILRFSNGSLIPHWSSDAWTCAVGRMAAVMEALAEGSASIVAVDTIVRVGNTREMSWGDWQRSIEQ